MNKQEFLEQLKQALRGLSQEEREGRLSFYAEMIDDRMEEGLSEEEAVAQIGSVDEVVVRIVEETPFEKNAKQRIKPNRKRKCWEIVLLVLGFPVWGSLLISVLAVVFSLYVSLWAIIISLWAVDLSVAVSSAGAIFMAVVYMFNGNVVPATAMLPGSMVTAGLAIFFFFGCKAATKGTVWLTKKMAVCLKKWFVRGDEAA